MNEYDLLNMYLNLISKDHSAFLHRLFEKYEDFVVMKQWLHTNDIDIPFLELLDRQQFYYCVNAKSFEDIGSFLKVDCVKQIEKLKEATRSLYHVVFLPGVETTDDLSTCFTNSDWTNMYQNDQCKLFTINQSLLKNELSFQGPSIPFFKALHQIEKWPGILVIKDNQFCFIKTQSRMDVDNAFTKIKNNTVFSSYQEKEDACYIAHLSDLHLGPKKRQKGLLVLEESLFELKDQLHTTSQLQIVITGDTMNSPALKGMHEASAFLNKMRRVFKARVTFVLGNHDVSFHGLHLLTRKTSKIVGYFLGGNIEIIEDQKIIFIRMNSTLEGNLARGKVGKKQMEEITEELQEVSNLHDYCLIALIHHHILPIEKEEFLKINWHEKRFIGRMVETTKELLDADEVMDWLIKNKIHYVMHGHKHIPFVSQQAKLTIIASGASSGGGVKEKTSKYLNYNLLKYDRKNQKIKYCFTYYDDTTKKERQRVKVHLF